MTKKERKGFETSREFLALPPASMLADRGKRNPPPPGQETIFLSLNKLFQGL